MMRVRTIAVLVICAALLAPQSATPQSRARGAPNQGRQPQRPKLVVVMVVDQMRADYFERYGHQWTKGLRRLMEHGAWFRQAAYPYMNTVTCAGHATIATGSFPATHGMVQNAWWDREAGKQVSCTEDPQVKAVSYGSPAARAEHSAARLAVPTLADELRAQSADGTRVVALSIKPRSAVMLAGHRGDAVTWFEDTNGALVTSTAFAAAPVPAVEQFVRKNPIENDFRKMWSLALWESAYLYTDDMSGERPPEGWTRTFPHQLKGKSEKPDGGFYGRWEQSPYADAYLGALAASLVDQMELGRRGATDFLGVSFSALDFTGHDYGPRSEEVQDLLVRLDGTIGELLAHLDDAVGRGNYVVAFSSDHGVAPIPEQMTRQGIDAGRVVIQDVVGRIEKALEPHFGPGKHVARMTYPDVYFEPGVYARIQQDQVALKSVIEAIRGVPGIWRVYRSEEMKEARNSQDVTTRAVALSYFEGRSGDLIAIPKPYWFFVNASNETPPGPGATHGTSHSYDSRVPVILMGEGIKAGEYLTAASPADIAPTLAFLCGVTMARTDGKLLIEALERPAAPAVRGAAQIARPKKP